MDEQTKTRCIQLLEWMPRRGTNSQTLAREMGIDAEEMTLLCIEIGKHFEIDIRHDPGKDWIGIAPDDFEKAQRIVETYDRRTAST